MKLIYWNTKNANDLEIISEILEHEKPDILFLSEIKDQVISDNYDVLEELEYVHIENPGCERVLIITKKSLKSELGLQHKFYTSLHCEGLVMVSVHFPSAMHRHMDASKFFFYKFREAINNFVGDSIETSILIIGDFNVNPFEEALINFDGFSATNSRVANNKITRDGNTISTYFNPTWQLFSEEPFIGSYRFARPSGYAFDIIEFHLLDQVLISQNLKESLIFDKISILKATKTKQLFDISRRKVLVSDHLPLIYEFEKK